MCEKFYIMGKGQFFSERDRGKYLTIAKCLLNKLKHKHRQECCFIFSDEKNFVQIQEVNSKNGHWLYKIPEKVATVTFTILLMILTNREQQRLTDTSICLSSKLQSQRCCIFRGFKDLDYFQPMCEMHFKKILHHCIQP